MVFFSLFPIQISPPDFLRFHTLPCWFLPFSPTTSLLLKLFKKKTDLIGEESMAKFFGPVQSDGLGDR